MKTRIFAVAAASAALLALAAPDEAQARSAVQFGVGPGGFYLNVQPQPRYHGYGYSPYYYVQPPAYYHDHDYYEEPYYYEHYQYRHKRKKIYEDAN